MEASNNNSTKYCRTYLADGAEGEAEGDARPDPALVQHGAGAVQVEDVSTLQHDGGRGGQRLREADHAHVVRVLPQRRLVGRPAPVQAGEASLLARDAPARVPALQGLGARVLGVGLEETVKGSNMHLVRCSIKNTSSHKAAAYFVLTQQI